ncbi:MAG TPA: DUF4177 domain-containing protein [Rudaea sp.]|nr:DUF4177 domain-containing protein [Rudaea sp.]
MSTEYRVAELSDPSFIAGRIDPKDVEKLINEIAADGWEFVALTSQSGVGVSLAVMAVFRRERT